MPTQWSSEPSLLALVGQPWIVLGWEVHNKHNWNQNFVYIRVDGRPEMYSYQEEALPYSPILVPTISETGFLRCRRLPLGVKYKFVVSVFQTTSPKGPHFDGKFRDFSYSGLCFSLAPKLTRPGVLPQLFFIFWQHPWWNLERKLQFKKKTYENTTFLHQANKSLRAKRSRDRQVSSLTLSGGQVIHSRLSMPWSRLQSPTWISVKNS